VTIEDLRRSVDAARVGREMHEWMAELYPICRSITGDGVRETLALIKQQIPLTVHEVASGTKVFDWTVPKEWNIRDASVRKADGERVIDFRKSNLHVLNYSVPVRARMSLEELKPHLFPLPEHPGWIPYRTSYYEERWGFCLSQDQLMRLGDGEYEVCIDASLEDGHLTYGEYYLEGETTDEVLMSCHVCHPSLANDNLSGVALVTFLARYLSTLPLRYSYRFLFIPGTIGSITWLSMNEPNVGRIRHGLVVACVGDAGQSTYKKSRRGDAEIDRAVIHVLKHSGAPYEVLDFSPYGYDERQFCSPGFDLSVGCLMRTPYGRFPEYHTSADNLAFVHPFALGDSLVKGLAVVEVLEGNRTYVNQNPRCEPQLGKRGLYRMIGGRTDAGLDELAMLWVLNLADGKHTLLDIAERSGQPFAALRIAADALVAHGLLTEARGKSYPRSAREDELDFRRLRSQ
jgi:aminopeptidase-like protein